MISKDQLPLIELNGKQRLAVTAAWVAPALAVMIDVVRTFVATSRVNPPEGLAFVAGLLWTAFLARSDWRGLLVDMVRLLLSRLGWFVFTLAAFLVTAVAMFNALGAFWFGVSGSLWLVTVVAVSLALSANRRRFFMQVALLGLNIVLLIAADALIGVFVLPGMSHNKLFIQHDPILGWRLRPGPPVTRKHAEYTSVESVNSWGFRTPEVSISKPPGIKRILVVGDSHAEGYTVNDDETCSRLLEKNLAGSVPVEVISLGVGGYATDQEFLSYLHYGRQLDPDIVLLMFCANDIDGNSDGRHGRSQKPYFTKHGETITLTGVPIPDIYSTGLFGPELLRKSCLVVLLEGIFANLSVRPKEAEKLSDEYGWEVTRLILRDFVEAVRRDGTRMVAMYVNPAESDMAKSDARLRTVLAEFSIPYIDTASAYKDDYSSYFVSNHWNQKGQRAVANALTQPLLELLRSTAPPAAGSP